MSHATQFIGFVLVTIGGVMSFSILANGVPGDHAAAAVFGGLSVAGVVLGGVNGFVAYLGPFHVGSHADFGDSRAFRVLRWVFGIHYSPCGCLWVKDAGAYPVDTGPEREVIESADVWTVEDLGAKVRYVPRTEERVRCVVCGNSHLRLTVTDSYKRSSRERWKDTERLDSGDDRPVVTEAEYP